MAMTSRDVMFIIRSTDYASRDVRRLSETFGRLGKQLRQINDTMGRELTNSQQKYNKEIRQAYNDQQRVIQPLKQQNEQIATQNNRMREQIRLNRDKIAGSKTVVAGQRAEADSLRAANARLTENIAVNRRRFDTNAEGYRRMSTTQQQFYTQQIARDRESLRINNDQIRALERSARAREQLNQPAWNRANEQLNRDILRNNVLRSENNERIGEANRLYQNSTRLSKEQAAAREMAIRREAEFAKQRIQHQQQLIQRTLAAGAAMTLTGAIMIGTGSAVIGKLKSMSDAALDFRREITLAYIQADPAEVITSIGELSDVALRVMREVPAAADTIPQTLFYIFTSMNVQVEEAEKLLRGFAMEAVAGNSSVEAAAKSTIAIINGMGLATEDLERIQDFQFQTVRKGVITYEQLANNIGKLIPALRRSGQEIETGGAMLAFLTRNGLSAEMATTAAARALELLFDPRVVRRMEDMGISMRQNNGEFLDLVDILEQLSNEIGSLPSFERAERMLELFGGAGYRIQARRFFDVVIPNFKQFKEHIDWQINNAGSFARAVDTMFKDPATRIQLFRNQWEALRIQMGGAFVPILLQLVEIGQRFTAWLNEIDPATRDAALRFIGLSAAGVTVVGILLTMAGLFVTIAGMMAMLTGNIGLAIAMTAGLPIVFTAVVAALIAFIFYGDQTRELLTRLREYFQTAEGRALAFAIAVGSITAATMLANTAMGVWVSRNIAGLITGLGNLNRIIPAVRTALASLNAVNPVLLALTAITMAAVGAFMVLRRRAQELKDAVDNQVQSLVLLIDSFTDGSIAIDNYSNAIDDSIRETARAVLIENDLHKAIQATNNLRMKDVLDGITNENDAREKTREAIQAEVDALRENLNWMERRRHYGVLNMSADRERYFTMLDFLDAYDRESIAADKSVDGMIAQLRAGDDLHNMIADYLELQDVQHIRAQELAHTRKKEIEAALDLAVATGELTEQEKLLLMGIVDLDEATGEIIETMNEASEAARNLSSVMGELTSVSNAWQDALDKINESRDDPLETLKGLTNAADLWAESLRESASVTDDMFTDMANIMHEKGSLMEGDAGLVMAAILAMGDSAPDAMAVLAGADEEPFLEILENIRRQAIWTSEVVIDSIDGMLAGWEEVLDKHGPELNNRMGDITDAVATTVYRHSVVTQDHARDLMVAYADIIASGKEPTQAEMDAVGVAMAMSAELGGELTVKAIADELDVGIGVIQRILSQYGTSIAFGLNPILTALGKQALKAYDVRMPGGRLNKGGLVPGGGPDRDSVLTYLTPGEFVLRRRAVEDLDLHGLHEMNRTGDVGALVKRYNAGGFVTAADVPAPPKHYRPPTYPFDEPAHGSAERMHREAVNFMNHYAPPLSAGIGWQSMWQAVSRRFPGVGLHSAFRPGARTATGQPSYHGQGRAIDISPRMDIFNWLAQNYRNSREIIFSPANSRQIHNGRNHMYSGITRSMHFDHIHWAMANGGMGRVDGPTWFLAGENGPEDFAFSPVGTSRKIGDGPGIGENVDPIAMRRDSNISGGIWNILPWMDRFSEKYATVMRQATEENVSSVRNIQSALSAMQTHLAAQHGLAAAKREVEQYRNEMVKLASDAEKVELALEKAWKQAHKVTAAEEIAIIDAERRMRTAQYEMESMERGVHSLNNELAVLRQESRIEDLQRSLEEMQSGVVDNSEREEQVQIVQQAKAEYIGAQFELQRMQAVLPTMDDEVQRLLAQFKAENALAGSHKTLLEEQKKLNDMQQNTGASARDLRIAEIELSLAKEDLIRLQKEQKYETQDLRYAQLQLEVAQDNLTQTIIDSTGPTQEVIDLQNELEEIRQRQIDVTYDLRSAQERMSEAEIEATIATLGLIQAGQSLVDLGPEQYRFFEELARVAGMSETAIRNVTRATQELSGGSANINKAIEQHSGWDKVAVEGGFQDTYDRIREIFVNRKVAIATPHETEVQRLTRIAHEVLSGQRTMNSVRNSVQQIADDPTRTYDGGGILPPGVTRAVNKTGQNEYVFTADQLKNLGGSTLTIEEGAFQVRIDGDVTPDVLPAVQAEIEDMLEKMMMELRSNN